MVWGLSDLFVGEVIAFYGSRERAERALRAVLRDEPDWKGMIEIVTVPERRRCQTPCRSSRRRHHRV